MGDATGGIVGHRAAEFLLGHFFVRHRFDHVRPGNEHVGSVAGHENKISNGRRVDRTSGAGPHDGADLGNHAASQRIAQENFGVAGQGFHALLNSRSARII